MAGAIKTGSSKRGGGGLNSEPNVIPFIDIMLVLLIIFMVASPPPTVDIKVDLPPPNSQNPPTPPLDRPTFVSLEDDAGQLTYYIGGQQVAYAQLADQLLNVARVNNPTMRGDDVQLFLEAKIFVDADQETSYSNVVGLMNVVDSVGFKKVSLVAEEAQF